MAEQKKCLKRLHKACSCERVAGHDGPCNCIGEAGTALGNALDELAVDRLVKLEDTVSRVWDLAKRRDHFVMRSALVAALKGETDG